MKIRTELWSFIPQNLHGGFWVSHYSNAHNATLPSRWIALFQTAMEAFIWVIVLFAYFIVLVLDANGLLCSAIIWTPLFFE